MRVLSFMETGRPSWLDFTPEASSSGGGLDIICVDHHEMLS